MNIALFGAGGRMGKCVTAVAKERNHTVWEIEKHTDWTHQPPQQVDVVIDFSTADATQAVCCFCQTHRCPLVTGVTGRSELQQQLLDKTNQLVPVVESVNFSTGIQMLTKICKLLSQLNWDCEIVETHHNQKADCPSGTAKQLAAEISQNGTRKVTVHGLRCGSNLGRHEVIFATQGESITVIHQAENRKIFALGAVKCAEELAKKH